MTLILTEHSLNGIALATDTLWTRRSRRSYPDPKLFEIPYLNAAVSTWGGTPEDHLPQHEWLPDFIEESEGRANTIYEFARELEQLCISEFGMMERISGSLSGKPRASLGFHIAGYEGSKRIFFNINNNPSQGEPEMISGNSLCVKLEDWRDEAENTPSPGVGWLVHNGDWEGFKVFFELFKRYRDVVRPGEGLMKIPSTGEIEDHGKFLGLLIHFVSGVWELSDITDVDPTNIGGDIHVLTMTPEGSSGRKTLKMRGEGLALV